jgi:glycosyltransferase involved in cell wall biosynthesis
VTVTCSAPRGSGGLGRHLEEILDALERRGAAGESISGEPRAAVSAGSFGARATLAAPALVRSLGALGVPVTPGIRARALMAAFDTYAAARLGGGEHLIAFNGQAREQFRAAGAAGYRSLSLVSANSHLRRVRRRHELARRRYPLERSWASLLLERNLAEYAAAERIYVASSYIRESFLEEGFDEHRLIDLPLTPDPRFLPRPEPPSEGGFEIVYVGSLAVHKGVPLLIDAVRRLTHRDLALTLVGGWASRGMRRFVQEACAADPRISARPGDPLPHLQRARLCVHPAYEDGFGYAPAEALACGVPVIVSEDTGMKDLIGAPGAGVVVASDDMDALTEAIDAAYRGEILGG